MATLGLAKFAKYFLWGFSFNYGFNENLKDSYYFKKDDKLFKGVGGHLAPPITLLIVIRI